MNRTTALLLAVLLLLGLTGCRQKEYFMPEPEGKTPQATFVDEMRAKSGGDINKLTPEERAKLQEVTRGFGEVALQSPPVKR